MDDKTSISNAHYLVFRESSLLLFETLKIYCLSYFIFLCALLPRSSSSLFCWKFNKLLRNHTNNNKSLF